MKISYIKIIFYKFLSKINMKILNLINALCKRVNDFENKKIQSTLRPFLSKAYHDVNSDVKHTDEFTKIVWVFWWQGYNDEMPIIVKKCIDSILSHSGDFKVVLITKNNVHKYTNIPKYIYYKLDNRHITFTQFSDILRYNLLKNYGGIWIDSTMYCISNLYSNNFNQKSLFTTVGANNEYHYWVSGKWTGSLIGGYKENELFQFMSNFFNIYWKYNNELINYNLVDYALWFAYKKNIGTFKDSINSICSYNNINKFKLVGVLNYKYNNELYKKITSNTQLFKLTYKQTFNNNGDTFYHRLITNKLF